MKLVQKDGESEFWVMDVPLGVLTNCTFMDVLQWDASWGIAGGTTLLGEGPSSSNCDGLLLTSDVVIIACYLGVTFVVKIHSCSDVIILLCSFVFVGAD